MDIIKKKMLENLFKSVLNLQELIKIVFVYTHGNHTILDITFDDENYAIVTYKEEGVNEARVYLDEILSYMN